MKSSTLEAPREIAARATPTEFSDAEWEHVLRALPVDLEATARQAGALTRRRQVGTAADLLRIVLAYAVCDFSLRVLGAWCVLRQLGNLSHVALRKRLRQSRRWLGGLLVAVLRQRRVMLAGLPGVRLRLIDATVISQPGSTGTDWRVHLCLDLEHLCLDAIEVTDAQGAETLARCDPDRHAIQVADRGYGYASSLAVGLDLAAPLIGRINWQNVPLEDAARQRVDVIAWLRQTFAAARQSEAERTVWLSHGTGRYRLRLIAGALPPEAAARARQRVRAAARKKGRTPNEETLSAAGFVLLLTNLAEDDYAPRVCLAVYRLRWQVELLMKRLKSILDLDELRARDAEMAQTYLLAKLLAALCLDRATLSLAEHLDGWLMDEQRPLSAWRWTALQWAMLRSTIQGHLSWADVLAALPSLHRFLCDAPRRRRQQAVAARVWLASLVSC